MWYFLVLVLVRSILAMAVMAVGILDPLEAEDKPSNIPGGILHDYFLPILDSLETRTSTTIR